MHLVEFDIVGMGCGRCVGTVTKVMGELLASKRNVWCLGRLLDRPKRLEAGSGSRIGTVVA